MPAAERPDDLADRDLLVAVAREAGEIARSFHGREQTVWLKENDSPVGEADYAVNEFVRGRLAEARPDYAILSEETPDDPVRRGASRLFIIDPIDGTRDFLQGGKNWTIPLAVVAAGRPVAAAIFAPMFDEMFDAAPGAGARLNGAPTRVSSGTDLAAIRLSGTRTTLAPLLELSEYNRTSRRYIASLAYRLVLVAAGRVHVSLARPGARDWDMAAADLVLQEAGGVLTDLAGQQIRYNGESVVQPAVVAASTELHERVRAVLAADQPSSQKEDASI